MPAETAWLIMTAGKSTLVLATALLLGAALRRAPGSARHRLWTLAFAALLVLPAMALLLPPLPLPLPTLPARLEWSPAATEAAAIAPTREATADEHGAADTNGNASSTGHGSDPQEPTPARRTSGNWGDTHPLSGFFLVWLTGFAAGTLFLATGIWRGRSQVRRARPLDDDEWLRDLEWHRNFFDIRRRVRLLQSSQARTPMTGGIWRPVILVPETAATWSPVRRRVVLLHELVHIRRYDVVRHLLTRLGIALYWFHPLAWLAGRSSTIAREQACDEEVLRLGIRPSVYASHLLELATTLTPGPIPAAALPMIQRSHLEKRLMKILDDNGSPAAARTSAAAATLMVLMALTASAAVPREQQAPDSEAALLSLGQTPGSPPVAAAQESACWSGSRLRGQFSGSISTDDRSGVRVLNGVGISNGDRIVQRWVDDLRLCMRARGNVVFEQDDALLAAIGEGGEVIMEAQLGDQLQSLTIRNDGAGEQSTWSVGGAVRPVDANVERWREQVTEALADFARIVRLRGERSSLRGEISSLRGQRSSLQGEISSIRGQRSSLQGEISSIRGRRSSLEGEISSARGQVSSLRGQISSARGHVSSLRGQIASHRGALQGLDASRYGASEDELVVIDAAKRRHEEAISDLERQIADYDVDGKVAAIERQIAEYDLDGRIDEIRGRMPRADEEALIADVERRIAALDVEGEVAAIEAQILALDLERKVAEIEAQIEALNVDERVGELEQRLEPALRELRRTIQAVG